MKHDWVEDRTISKFAGTLKNTAATGLDTSQIGGFKNSGKLHVDPEWEQEENELAQATDQMEVLHSVLRNIEDLTLENEELRGHAQFHVERVRTKAC